MNEFHTRSSITFEMSSINIHPLTNNPTEAWRQMSAKQMILRINATTPTRDPDQTSLRFVCMSDTHSLTTHIKFDIPFGDVFIHAGDFTKCGGQEEVLDFNNWIGQLPHQIKIVIAGNHELSFDKTFTHPFKNPSSTESKVWDEIPTLGMAKESIYKAVSVVNIKEQLTNCIYLEDSGIELCGIKIYGTPWQPEFCKWAFNLPRGESCLKKWDHIPSDTDILITHTPPIGHGDLCCSGVRAGCVELLSTVQQRLKKLKYHIFGHIHEGYGISSDGRVVFINASTCNINYLPNNLPIVFDVKMPDGWTRDKWLFAAAKQL